jgi:hypothetical protein
VVTAADRAALVARYKDGTTAFTAAATAVAKAGRLDRRPDDGGWTARQVVHHMADAELTSAIRLRRLLVEDAPVIVGYDEAAFARTLHYDRPVGAALRTVEAARAATAELLDRLADAEWTRAGTHTEDGTYGVEDWLRIYAAHPFDHAEQLRRAAG